MLTMQEYASREAKLRRIARLMGHGINPILFSSGFYGAEDPNESPSGFHSRVDAIDRVPGTGLTVDGQSIAEIWNEVETRNAVFNRSASLTVALLSFPTTIAQRQIGQYATHQFEEATEFGRPHKVRLSRVARGFPRKHYDLGYGWTQEFLDDATAAEIRSISGQAERAYWELQMTLVLDALFQNTNVTDQDGVAVKRLWNADTEIPPKYKRWTHDGTHTHYLFSATLDEAALNSIEEHMVHHGYGDNGETLILHVNRAQLPTVQGLTKYVPAVTTNRPTVLSGPVRGTEPGGPAGLTVQGHHNLLTIVENNEIPAGYLLATATGGVFAAQNPVGLRTHDNPSARGLRLIEGPNQRYPIVDAVYDTYLGAGVGQRSAAVAMQIAGSYTAPTI